MNTVVSHAMEIGGSRYQHGVQFGAVLYTAILKQPRLSAILLIVNHVFTT